MSNEELKKNHRRYYRIAGITIQVESDIPMTDSTFLPKFKLFQVDGPDEDIVILRHHFSLPDLDSWDLEKEVYRELPWVIYRKGDSWVYVGILPPERGGEIWKVAVFNNDHSEGDIYNPSDEIFRSGNRYSLTTFPTDQILIAQVLAYRDGCYMHSSGANLYGKGLLFVGHSDAGKSTMVTMLRDRAEILCDDRMIVRRWPEGHRIHGTWSHGDVPDVSPGSAPLRAILFLQQAPENRLIPFDDTKAIMQRLLACLIKPLATADWWQRELSIVERMIQEVPFYIVEFDKSGRILDSLERL